MLTEQQISLLKQKLIPQSEIDKMESFDEDSLIATYKDGSQRQVAEGVYTRVMGYFRRVEDGNLGKRSEYAERVCFKESVAMKHVEAAVAAE